MIQVHEGQCGLCTHFGEHDSAAQAQIIQIRTKREAPPTLTETCAHPKHAPLHLVVTAVSGCQGFEQASVNA